ncbi:right-handed parallel beta-helix repeat-containing protein [Chloroflexota bacterium]
MINKKVIAILLTLVLVLGICLPAVPVIAGTFPWLFPHTGVDLPSNYIAGETRTYVISFHPATTATLKSLDVEFESGFDVSGADSGIFTYDVSVSGQVVTITLDPPVSADAGVFQSFSIGNLIHPTATGTYSITVTTYDETPAVVDSGSATVTIYPDAATGIDISADNNPVTAGGTVTFNSMSVDQYGNEIDAVNAGTSFSIGLDAGTWQTNRILTAEKVGDWEVSGNHATLGTDTLTLTINPGAFDAEESILEVDSSDVTAGDTVAVTVTPQDEWCNSLGTGLTVVVLLDGAAVDAGGAIDVTDEGDGTYTASVQVTDTSAANVISATVGGASVTHTETITVSPDAASGIVISADDASIKVSETATFTAMSADVWDNEIDDVTADTIFSIEAGAGGSWADYVYTSGNPGTWTVTGTHATLGTDTLDLAVGVGLTVIDQPDETVAGQAIGPVTVLLRDASGSIVIGDDVTVAEAGSYSFDDGTTTRSTNGSGIATFDNLEINTAATGYQLVFSVGSYDDETSDAFDVIAAGLSSFVIVQQPSDAAADATIYPAVTVRALDQFSNNVPDESISATLTAGPGGILSGTLTATTEANGVATFDDLSIDTVGTGYKLGFGQGGVPPVDSGPFDINTATVYIGATPYSAIQSAINAASSGDNITIQAGTYTEDLSIDKSVTLTGAGATTTKITGSGVAPAITIGDYYVTIQGLDIDVAGYPGISIDDLRTNTVTIEDVVIEGNSSHGIYAGTVKLSGILNVLDCIIADNGGHGIYIELVDTWGIVEIIGNKIGAWEDDDWDFPANTDDGIHIDEILDDSNVEISDNIICDNGKEGIYVDGMYYGSTLTIEGNTIGAYAYDSYTFFGNISNGIEIQDVDYGCTVTIKDNDITENSDEGIYIDQIGYDYTDSDGVWGSENATDYCALYQIWGANTVTIEGNDISRNSVDGIYICETDFAAYLTIQDNTISENAYEGIYIYYLGDYASSSYGNFYLDEDTADVRLNPDYPDYFGPVVLIKGNTITDNEYDGIYNGEDWEFDASVTIEDNIITGNGDAGICHDYGMTNDSHVLIKGNTIASNGASGGYGGICMDDCVEYGSSYTIEDNFIGENYGSGVYIEDVYEDGSLVIRNNTIGAGNDSLGDPYDGNTCEGIYIDYVEYSSTAEITGNVIAENGVSGGYEGIYIYEVYEESSLSITCNDILNNDSYGINVYALYDDCSLSIHGNNIVGNTAYGLTYDDSTDFDATNNWWGDASGPTHAGNPGGSGDEIDSDYVEYDPWLTLEAGGGTSECTVSGTVTVDAKDEAGTEVVKSGSGTPTITTFEYTDNPGGTTPSGFTALDKYIDVYLDDTTDVTEIEIRNYYTSAEVSGLDEASLTLAWWDGAAWVECSVSGAEYPAGEPTYRGYIWAKIRTDTTPTLADLTGSAFMSMGTPPAPTGGGGGDSNVTISLTDLVASRSLRVDNRGIVLYDSQIQTTDGKFSLDIGKGTKLLDSQSDPLESLSVVAEASPPAVPSGKAIVMAYNFGPNGASFTPVITLTAAYDPQGLPQGVAERDLYIAYWDGSQWLTLETTVNTEANTVSCQLSHFTTFAVISAVTTEEEVVPEEEEVVPEEEEVVPEEEEVVPEEEEVGLAWWIWLIVGIAAAAAIGVTAWQVMIRRRA